MSIKSNITRNLSIFLMDRFLKPEILEGKKKDYKFYAMETKLLGKSYLQYPNEEFWRNMNLGFQLNSFAFFVSKQGKDELEKQWRIFQLSKRLDSNPKTPTFEENRVPEVSGIYKKQDVLDWIDS